MTVSGILRKISPKVIFAVLGVGLVVALLFFLSRQVVSRKKPTPPAAAKPAVSLAKKEINRELPLQLKGKEKLKVSYWIESAELVEEIFVKGEKVKPLSGKAFLLLNLKIINNSQQGIQMNSRDFVRLSLAGKDEWFAPEIHNDPVEIQAIATKYTRLGFLVSLSEKQFKIRLGEIGGEKSEFELNF